MARPRFAAALDAALYRRLARKRVASVPLADTGYVDVAGERLRVLDTGGDLPVLLLAPDGPCVIEHYLDIVDELRGEFRVLVADLPGFGFSAPSARHDHTLERGAELLIGLLDALSIRSATLALSCVNGYYAIAAAQLAPDRIDRLVLSQTPGIEAMQDWVTRIVPGPIRVPMVGQLLNFAVRERTAEGWFKAALAQRDARPHFQGISRNNLRHGGCFCFAGVVQGMTNSGTALTASPSPDVPATLVWGLDDRSHRATDPESIHSLLPQAEILRLPGVGHFPDLEAPKTFAAALRQAAGSAA